MLFNSNVFIFAFLPIVLVGYYSVRRVLSPAAGLAWLFASSIVFYAYWSPRYVVLILGSIAVNFALGKALYRRRTRGLLTLGVVFNLGLLGFYKYLGFFVESGNRLFDAGWVVPEIVLPIGISFFTFQQIAFLVDMYTEGGDDPTWVHYGVFVSFFPQLIAGPIVHHKEMMPQFRELAHRTQRLENFALGLTLFVIGLSKKVLIADSLSTRAGVTFGAAADGVVPNLIEAWTGVLAYTFQIYFDFSGYSDMAIGLGLLFGVRLPANFLSPYKARNIIDFWRRWHVTLSRFLRDYLYFPLGGNRKGPTRRYVNLMTVMLLGGLWHGAGWTFVLWGGLHGFYLIVAHAWARLSRPTERRWYQGFAFAVTFLAVVGGWVTFRATSLDAAMNVYGGLIGYGGFALPTEIAAVAERVGLGGLVERVGVFEPPSRSLLYLGWVWIGVAAALAFFFPNSLELTRRFRPVVDLDRLDAVRAAGGLFGALRWRPTAAAAVVVGLLAVAVVKFLNTAAESEFLYFQF